MVTKLSNLGEITTNFILDDFDFYIMNTSATGNYVAGDWAKVGYTSAEKNLNPNRERYTREDKIPRVPTFKKTIRKNFQATFGLSNQNPDLEAIVNNATKSWTSTLGTRIAHGTDEPATEYRACRFATKLEDGRWYTITIPKSELSQNGEKNYGGESEVVTPLILEAIYNPSADATANMYYENYVTLGVNPTADVPPGYV
jgi:hypothetical protein